MRNDILKAFIALLFILISGHAFAQQRWISFDGSPMGASPTMTVLQSDDSGYYVQIVLHGIYVEPILQGDTMYNKLSLEQSFSTISQVGFPALPKISQNIAIPAKKKQASFVTLIDSLNITTDLIYPFVECKKESETVSFFKNDSIYNADVYDNLLNESHIHTYRGVNNFTVDVCPFKYYPKDSQLTIYRTFNLKIEFQGADIETSQSNMPLFTSYEVLFNNYIHDIQNGADLKLTDATDSIYNYLIIVGDDSAIYNSSALKRFCTWKAYKGFSTKVISTLDIGCTCASIKNYIKSEYTKYGIQYVLFIGDDDKIPLYDWVSGQNEITKSDYWYGCMDGDSDTQADMAIGRFSVNNLDELNNMIEKTISYESSVNNNAQKALLVAHKENAPSKYQNCLEEIRNAAYENPMLFTKVYGAAEEKGGTNGTNSDVIDAINAGLNIVNYRGHGNWDRWADSWSFDNMGFTSYQVSMLTNTAYPVVFSIACQNSNIRNRTCLMENFMRSSHGSVSFLGATEDSYTYPNHTFDKILFDNLLNNNIYNVGVLNVVSHIMNFANYESLATTNAFCYICGGDPSLEIFTQSAKTFENVVATRTGYEVRITVAAENGYKVSVVSEDGNLLGSYSTPSNNIVLSDVPANAHIVLNKHNHIPCELNTMNMIYVQDETISDEREYDGERIEVGYDVTQTKTYGNVIVKKGASLSLKSQIETIIKNGFECERGAELQIK